MTAAARGARPAHLALWWLLLLAPPALVWWAPLGDVETYWEYARLTFAGHVPYRDIGIEYPPLALLAFYVPYPLARSPAAYAVAFVACMAAVDMALKLWLWRRLAGPRRAAWYLFCASTALLFYTHLTRFDVLPMACMVLAVAGWQDRPRRVGPWLWLSLGAGLKPIPGLLTPVGLSSAAQQGLPPRRTAGHLAAALGLGVAPLAVAWLVAGPASGSWVSFHASRGLHVATTYAALHLLAGGLGQPVPAAYAFGCLQVLPPWGARCAAWAAPVTGTLLVLSAVAGWRGLRRVGPDALWHAAACLILAFMLGNKVFSPQYMLWLVPLVALAAAHGRGDVWLAAGLVVACGCTALLHPGEEDLAAGSLWRQLVLVVRVAVLAGLWARLWACLWRPQRRAAAS